MRYLIRFSYDGTGFSGYQKQPGERTVEGMLENALYNINNHTETRIFSSGRTDRGVHALGQVAHFDIDVNITLYKLKCALNSLLPEDIHVLSTEIVDKNFHARYNAISKTYIYKINVGEYSPIDRNHVYQYCKDLNFDNMRLAINDFLGEHDFKPFVSEEAIKSSYVRTIYSVDMKKEGDIITKLNGEEVENAAYLRYELYKYAPGDTITLTYLRDGKEHETKAVLSKSE